MKSKILALMLLFAAGTLGAQTKLTVEIRGIKEAKGQIMAAVFAENGFLKQPVDAKIVKIEGETASVVFDKIAAGDYAVAVFQDTNENYRLEQGENGIPTEPWGFSNNFVPKTGAPTFFDLKFAVKPDEETVETITLR
ncbi:MAG: DUF2141 domain-containing protein [Dysgonamonadaceae bacterium]|jgi:uncharacterized protein (DUF2141 family)|nr:DUF2141 domain-containing protein [Dysgonamonadaceae bacterium]